MASDDEVEFDALFTLGLECGIISESEYDTMTDRLAEGLADVTFRSCIEAWRPRIEGGAGAVAAHGRVVGAPTEALLRALGVATGMPPAAACCHLGLLALGQQAADFELSCHICGSAKPEPASSGGFFALRDPQGGKELRLECGGCLARAAHAQGVSVAGAAAFVLARVIPPAELLVFLGCESDDDDDGDDGDSNEAAGEEGSDGSDDLSDIPLGGVIGASPTAGGGAHPVLSLLALEQSVRESLARRGVAEALEPLERLTGMMAEAPNHFELTYEAEDASCPPWSAPGANRAFIREQVLPLWLRALGDDACPSDACAVLLPRLWGWLTLFHGLGLLGSGGGGSTAVSQLEALFVKHCGKKPPHRLRF